MPRPPAAIGSGESQKARRLAWQFASRAALALAADGEPLHMRRAKPADFQLIEQMINDAKERLKELGTDQWSDDWPDKFGRRRMDRVRSSIEQRKTWLAEFRVPFDAGIMMIPAATVTIERKGSTVVWKEHELKMYPAVYLSRLVVAKGFFSYDIGSSIIDWAGRRGLKQRNAKSIRIDVWTKNLALHNYYLKRGFQECGKVTDKNYPAGQRLERLTSYDSGLRRRVLVGGRRQNTSGGMFI
jgi:hypothetical protein